MIRVAPFLCLFFITGAAAPAGEPAWITKTLAALDGHLDRHPAAEADDLYKLIHQAVAGPGHAIDDPAAARRWLEREISSLQPSDHADPLCEPIGGDPEMVRIHLRPYVEAGRDPAELLDAFVTSANLVEPEPDHLDAVLRAAVEHLENTGRGRFGDALDATRVQLTDQGFPAVHHSTTFRGAYAPAYRVVTRGLAEAAGWCDDQGTIDDTGHPDADAGADVDAGPLTGS